MYSVDGFKQDMEEALHDPRRYILAWAPHERTLRVLEDTKMRARSRKKGREHKEDADLTPETRIFKDKLDDVALKCWPFVLDLTSRDRISFLTRPAGFRMVLLFLFEVG